MTGTVVINGGGVRAVLPVTKVTSARSAGMDMIFKAAAVADYRPVHIADEKIKKSDSSTSIELERTDDILKYLGEHKTPGQFLCGFSMETENMLENSRKKLKKKNLDMVVICQCSA